MKESLNEKEIIDKIWEEMRIDINTFAVPKSLLREYLDGLIKDYGYCNCKLKEKDFHMTVVKDLEKMKRELLGEDFEGIKDEINCPQTNQSVQQGRYDELATDSSNADDSGKVKTEDTNERAIKMRRFVKPEKLEEFDKLISNVQARGKA